MVSILTIGLVAEILEPLREAGVADVRGLVKHMISDGCISND